MVDDDIKLLIQEILVMVGLGIDDRPFGKFSRSHVFDEPLINPEEFDESQVITPLNGIDMVNRCMSYLPPEKSF